MPNSIVLTVDGKEVYNYTAPVVPVTPSPTPVASTTGVDFPMNEDQLRDAMLTAVKEKRQCVLDPRVKISMTKPIVIQAPDTAGMPWGVNGNFAQLVWKGPGNQDMLTFLGTSKVNSRGLVIEKLAFDGNGYAAPPAGACLKLSAPTGDDGPLYKFKIKDVYTMYATRGFVLEGGVYEGYLDNVHAENHRSHGMECAHTNNAGVPRGIISNINIMHPNFSRNMGAGLKCTYSTNLIMGSFVLNALGGVVAPEGLRYASGNNGENTGEALFNIAWNGYGSLIVGNEVSSDGSTHARSFTNGAWVDVGVPCLYLLAGDSAVVQKDNHCSYYGGASPNPMRVVK